MQTPGHAPSATRDVDSEVVDLCRELIRIDTSNYGPGTPGPGERQTAEYCAEKLADVGIESQFFESEPGRTTLVAHWEPEGVDTSIPPLLIHCHNDVVPAEASDWTYPPFEAEIADDCIWGRGAVDMKDMNAMILSVVRARQREGRAPRRPIRLIFFADEEAGSTLGAHWMGENHPDMIADCSEAISEVGGFSLTVRDDLRLYLIQTAEKGIAWLKLIADGTAGHGSMRNSDNAVTELAAAIARIGAYEWPTRMHPAQRAFLDAIEDALEITINDDNVEDTLARLGSISRMIGATMSNTANPTMLTAGYKANVIPSRAEAQIDGRFIPGLHEEFLATIKELAGERVRVEHTTQRDSVETEFAGDLVDAMQWSLQQEDPQARTVPYLLSAGTDAKGFANRFGVRSFGFCPLQLPPELDFTAMFHGVDERVPVESLKFGARVLDHFLDRA